jgi:hypothetical protein
VTPGGGISKLLAVRSSSTRFLDDAVKVIALDPKLQLPWLVPGICANLKIRNHDDAGTNDLALSCGDCGCGEARGGKQARCEAMHESI